MKPGSKGSAFQSARLIVLFAIALAVGCETRGKSDTWDTASVIAKTAHDTRLAKAIARSRFVLDPSGGAIAVAWNKAAKAQGLTFGSRWPSDVRGAIDIGLATTKDVASGAKGDFAFRITHNELAESPLVHEAGRVSYRDIAPSIDLLATNDDAAVEWFYVLRDANAQAHFTMDVELGKGIAKVVARKDGAYAFEDARGTTRLRMPKPFAVDANGVKRDVALAWTGDATIASRGHIDVMLDTGGLAYPILVDPAVEHPIWQESVVDESTPPALQDASAVFDSSRGKTVLFGGFGNQPSTAITWEWNGTLWNQRDVDTAPSPRFCAAMAYDATRKVTVLFGGLGTASTANDTWEWDGTTWTQTALANPPSPRGCASMVYDSARGNVMMFGGSGAITGENYNDTWIWDGAVWTQATPVHVPPARSDATMSFDSARNVAVLFGGSGADFLGDTWEWDGTDWTARTSTAAPPAREDASMVYDVARAKTLLFGGLANGSLADLWEWDGTTWTTLAATGPAAREGAAMAYDTSRSVAVLFGGGDEGLPFDDTWEWNGTTWNQHAFTVAPTPRQEAAMAYDLKHSLTILFGGFDENGEEGDTWQWDGTSWSTRAPAKAPSARDSASMAFDESRGVAVLFGGENGDGVLNETWEWDGTTWAQIAAATSPPVRYGATMVYDVARVATVLFGGEGDANAPLGDTWTWDGTTWTSVNGSMPPARFDATMAYDVERARTVLFGGYSVNLAALGDTWTWDGTSWQELTPVVSPPARIGAAMAYDRARSKSVLFAGYDNQVGYYADTWEWDGTAWTSPSTIDSPSARIEASMAFDVARGSTVLFGGAQYQRVGDTWLYSSRGGGCTTNATCDTGACVDGVCCAQSSCGPCQSCVLLGHEGECSNVAAGTVPTTNDANACASPFVCTASGLCAAPVGATCTQATDCASGFCVDGICCDSACEGDCQACSMARGLSENGSCAFAPEGTSGRNACADNFACNGKSPTCATTCSDDATCAAGYYCAANGTCVAQKSEGASCNDAAGGDCLASGCRDCAAGNCVDNACCASCVGTKSLGADCTNDAQCESNHCVSGTCCASNCSTGTSTCSQGICSNEGATCSLPSGIQCRAESCTNGTHTFVATCNGKGDCGAVESQTCAPFSCGATTCNTTCASETDCATGATCDTSMHVCNYDATCSSDNTTLISTNGTSMPCSPYVCASNKCGSSCASIKDCASGFSCSASNACVPTTTTSPTTSNGCSCRAGARSSFADPRALGCLAFGIMLLVRRRRHANDGVMS